MRYELIKGFCSLRMDTGLTKSNNKITINMDCSGDEPIIIKQDGELPDEAFKERIIAGSMRNALSLR